MRRGVGQGSLPCSSMQTGPVSTNHVRAVRRCFLSNYLITIVFAVHARIHITTHKLYVLTYIL